MPETVSDHRRFTAVRRRIEPTAEVWCPRLERHVQLERCFDCQWLEAVSDKPPHPHVVCRAPRP